MKPFTPNVREHSIKLIFLIQEDAELLEVVKLMGIRKWGLIADRMNRNLPKDQQRKPKNYRDRWHNSLDPNINHQQWSEAEEM